LADILPLIIFTYNAPMIQLGATVFDPAAQMLRDSAGAKIALRAQSARVLECLVRANGALVTKEQLFKTVWADVAVTDDSLVQCIREIRTAIGDPQHAVLQTETRRGYRLLVNSHDSAWTNGAASMPAALSPSLHTADKLAIPAIAVMAFTSMEGDERSERLAMTFAGDLLTELARHKELRLIGGFASFSLRGQALSSSQVCDKLGARYIVSGRVQFTEALIDWSLEMMDGHNNELVWSERKRVNFLDIYLETTALIGRITGTIVSNLSAFTYRKAMTMAPESLNAYDLCARAYSFGTRDTPASVLEAQQLASEAVALLQKALSVSPGFNTARLTLLAALEETQQHASAADQYALLLRYSHGFIENHFGRRWNATPKLRARYLAALRAHGAVIAA
jgi:TolB-like protein